MATWAGTWQTTWGGSGTGTTPITFTEDGAGVTGTYPFKDGRITGRSTNGTLIGGWSQSPSRQPPADAGALTFVLHGRSFSGTWRYGTTGGTGQTWNGTCSGGPCLSNS